MLRAPRVKVATLDGEGRERTVFPYWTQYSITRDIRRYVQSARLTITPCTSTQARAMIAELDAAGRVACFVEGVRVLTGYVAEIESGQDSRQKAPAAVVTIEDVLGQTKDCDLPDGFGLTGLTVRQVAERVYQPFGLEVVVGNEGNRLALTRLPVSRTVRTTPDTDPELARIMRETSDEHAAAIATREYMEAHPTATVTRLAETAESRKLHPQPGEKIDAFMPRFARENGLMVWASGDGKVILSAPRWDQEPTYRLIRSKTVRTLHEGRIRSGRIVRQPGRVVHEVVVKGRTGKRGVDCVRGVARDEEAIALLAAQGRRHRTLTIPDASLRDQLAAQRRAETLLAQAQMSAKTYTAAVAGHGVGIALQAEDQMVGVYDDAALDEGGISLDSNLWCVGASYNSDKRGLRTELLFAWPQSWTE